MALADSIVKDTRIPPRGYIEHLREANSTDQWGEILHTRWQRTGRGAPIRTAQGSLALGDRLLKDGFESE